MPGDYLCNLVVPGAAKSGTTALHDILDRHPKIRMSSSKEPHFFCKSDRFAQGPAYHNALFNPHDTTTEVFGESSTGYMIWPQAVDRIRQSLDRPKIILMLRDPVGRAISHYRWRFRLGLEKRDLLTALRTDGYGFDPDRPDRFGYMAYLQFSQYATYCPMWLEAFGHENCLLISSRKLKSDFACTAARIAEFLGLHDAATLQLQEAHRTDALGRRPSAEMTRLASLLPSSWKTSQPYRVVRDELLKMLAPSPPDSVSMEAEQFLMQELADDIAFYSRIFDRA